MLIFVEGGKGRNVERKGDKMRGIDRVSKKWTDSGKEKRVRTSKKC